MGSTSSNEPIAVIGTACRFPGSCSSPSELWDLLRNPKDVVSRIPASRFNINRFYHKDALHHGTTNVSSGYFIDDGFIRHFDAEFFGIKPTEASTMDPQQRILLETVYEGLERAGLPMENLRGSSTGVFVGSMSCDYADILNRDIDQFPTYVTSGAARSILSNRISYIFDWHGPCMTIDTACSSSLVALHYAVRSLREGESSLAVVAGANVALGPEQFVAESKMKMLSPDGRSRMWDKYANGYARGEGVACLVLKTLSSAIADGDSIACLVRETGVNQDGRTKGLTMPSPTAQADLVRDTYLRAGLDLSKKADRPQFFEAHGTGTPAGDPVEAEAIQLALFGPSWGQPTGSDSTQIDEPLYVGSVKTVIGHTEGTAGIAGVMKGMLAIQNGVVPPNMWFNKLNPSVEPFYGRGRVHIPKLPRPWQKVVDGAPRRVSVNSFGFGGTNGHVILEQYAGPPETLPPTNGLSDPNIDDRERDAFSLQPWTSQGPFLFSAASESALKASLARYSAYIRNKASALNLGDLWWTLNTHRSALPFRVAVTASGAEDLANTLADMTTSLSVTAASGPIGLEQVSLLGIFTGQGAQWASMGAQLLKSSPLACQFLDRMQRSLDTLPSDHAPTWRLKEELCKDSATTRVGEAAFSQPLCTAVQVILTEHLEAAGVRFKAVVGHSSGEIAAAYASGFMSAEDAIRVAYYRGYFTSLAKNGGAMLAAGTTFEDAERLCDIMDGQICIAATNSPDSVTLSGDSVAIDEAKVILEDEGKFARRLQVDKAYHSPYMSPCSEPFIQALMSCGVKIQRPASKSRPAWISSVVGDHIDTWLMEHGPDTLHAQYWAENMLGRVQFSEAIESAVGAQGPFHMAIEVGPHPALKKPTVDCFTSLISQQLPYTGTMRRGANDVHAFSEALGALWNTAGSGAVDFKKFETHVRKPEGDLTPPKLLTDLPSYQWDHNRVFWHESRTSEAYRTDNQATHQLLGTKLPDGIKGQYRWKNDLSLKELPWLSGHQIQGQIIFPAAGYLCTTLEAIGLLYSNDSVQLVEMSDVSIDQPLIIPADSSVETSFSLILHKVETSDNSGGDSKTQLLRGSFAFFSASNKDHVSLVKNAFGKVKITLGAPDAEVLPRPAPKPEGLEFVPVEPERFYRITDDWGFEYQGPFRRLCDLSRRANEAMGCIQTPDAADEGDHPLLMHPATLDCAIQAVLALTNSYPGDGRIQCIYVPTGIDSIRFNMATCAQTIRSRSSGGVKMPFMAWSLPQQDMTALCGDAEVHSPDHQVTVVQLQGLRGKPLDPPAPSNDVQIFFDTKWGEETPTGTPQLIAGNAECQISGPDGQQDSTLTVSQSLVTFDMERVAYYYYRQIHAAVGHTNRSTLGWHYQRLLEYIDITLDQTAQGAHPYTKKAWDEDSREDILSLIDRYPGIIDFRMMQVVGDNLLPAMRGEVSILERMLENNLLNNFYVEALGMAPYLLDMSRMVTQMAHRSAHMDILEVGAGTGGATKTILKQLDEAFSSYTFTDVSSGFFDNAREHFKDVGDKMSFNVLDIEKDVEEQGFIPHSYDLVLASLVLHATSNLERTFCNVRKLLKPGGRVIILELTDEHCIRLNLIFGGLPGLWLGAKDNSCQRGLGPCVPIEEWEAVMVKAGFSQLEAVTPHNDSFPIPISVLMAQAVDERVALLRDPLSPTVNTLGAKVPLTIVGGQWELVTQIKAQVKRHYDVDPSVTHINSLESLAEVSLPFLGSIISLVDLEEPPVFVTMSDKKLAGLRNLFQSGQNIVWVTCGVSRGDNPWRNMFRGLQHSLTLEMKHLRIQLLEFETIKSVDSRIISTRMLQLEAARDMEERDQLRDLSWCREQEVLVRDGKPLICRIYHNHHRDQRYNSGRRPIGVATDVNSKPSVVSACSSGTELVLEERRLSGPLSSSDQEKVSIRPSHSLVHAVRLQNQAGVHFGFLSVGQDTASSERFVTVTPEIESQMLVPLSSAIKLPPELGSETVLVGVYWQILVDSILAGCEPLERIAILDPGFPLGTLLARRASELGISITLFSTNTGKEILGRPWASLHVHSRRQTVAKSLPPGLTRFVNIQGPKELMAVVESCLPPNCTVLAKASFLRPNAESRRTNVGSSITAGLSSQQLQIAVARCLAEGIFPNAKTLEAMRVAAPDDGLRLDRFAVSLDKQSILTWPSPTSKSALTHLKPASKVVSFSGEKSYWLVGLTGSMGLSICQWMASRGAKHIVVTSRNPKVNESWIEEMASLGCKIHIFAHDITNFEETKSVYHQICSTLPPIAGVAQGAMVLEDSLFTDVDLRRYEKVIKPKVIGSINLDKLFHDDSLDFFLFFSSVVCVTGNPGQSLYGAANAFMASLARERRQRGVASSVIQIGAILGTGYISREVSLAHQDYLRSIGHRMMSEQDVLEIVAEGILAGHPRSSTFWNPAPRGGSLNFDDFDFATGFNIRSKEQDLASLPVLQHLVPRESQNDTSGKIKSASGGAIKANLADAINLEAAGEILQESLMLKLQALLRADPNSAMLDKSLDDLGVDSLVAVDVRSWFIGELGVDMPTLKILNASSVRELGRLALDILPRHLIPKVSDGGREASPSPPAETPVSEKTSSSSSRLALSDVSRDAASPASDTTASTSPPTKSDASNTSHVKTLEDASPLERAQQDVSLDKQKHVAPQDSDGSLTTFQRVVPMSFGQARFWFMRQYVEDPTAFNITWMIRCHGLLRVQELKEAVHQLGQRHESLRTCFVTDTRTDSTMQGVLPHPRLQLEQISIANEQEAQELAQRMKGHVFDVEHGELLRIQLLTMSPTNHFILLGGHHVNMDGISWNVLISDLEKAYNGKLNTSPDRSDLLQYPDYSLKEQKEYKSGAWDDRLRFWANLFGQLPATLPVLPLAGRLVRPTTPQFGFHTVKTRLSKDLTRRAMELCRRVKVTPFHLYLAVFYVLLNRLAASSSEPDVKEVCIGVADGNRTTPGVQQTMGVFVNTLPLRLQCKNSKETFRNLLQQVRSVADAAFSNAVPFDVLVKHLGVPRDASYSPLVQAYVNYRQGIPEAQTLLGCDCSLDEVLGTGLTDHDVSLEIVDAAKTERGDAQIAISVQKGLYEPEAAELLLGGYQKLMEDLVANPAVWISRPSLWGQDQVDTALEAGRGTEIHASYPTIVHRMDASVERCPDRVALKEVGTGRSLTYSAMASRVEALAQHLSSCSVGPGAFAGVFQTAGSDWVCSLLAILRVGATYVPMEPKVGLDRLSLIARETGVSAVLVDSHTVELDFAKALLHPSDGSNPVRVINISPLPRSPDSTTAVPSPIRAHADDTSIIIPTSGSTGAPKGVVFSHSALSALADMLPIQWGLRQDQDTVLHQSSYMFDASIVQTIISLGVGSTIAIVGDDARGDPAALCSIIVEHGVDVAGATPTEYAAWARHWDIDVLRRSSWRLAMTWGEPFTHAAARDFHRLAKPDLKILDEGGPTEVCMMVEGEITKDEIQAAASNPDFLFSHFKCTPNKSIAIVDHNLNPLPAGAVGEIVVGGAIAKGYLNRDTETAEKFIDWAHHASPYFKARGWTTAHRTGDLGRMTKDGQVVLLGRMVGDTQVKLGGIRVDLKDVEATILQSHPAVLQCVVSARTEKDPDKIAAIFLVAFVVLSEASQASMSDEQRAGYLKRLPRTLPLPQYMRPTMVIEVPKLAISGNGKLDRRTMDSWLLSDYNSGASEGQGKLVLGLEPIEERMLKLWEQVLPQGVAQHYGGTITGETDFFHVGGTSLALINLLKLIRDEFGQSLSLLQIFQASTLTGMAGFLETRELVGNRANTTSGGDLVNWDEEASLPNISLDLMAGAKPRGIQPGRPPRVVVLTGATGFLGREIVRQLLDDTRVEKIYCLAVRKPVSELPDSPFRVGSRLNSKVVIKRGDLGAPRLGLSQDDAAAIFAEADAVIHVGAAVSFLKTYATLRATNVASTRELLVLSAPRRIPFHFVSTASVASLAVPDPDSSAPGARTSFGRESIAPYPPPTTAPSKLPGYVPAKWASEVLVERAAKAWRVPGWIHRPTSIVDESANELDLINNILLYTSKLRAAPDTRQWAGRMNFVSLVDAAQGILREVMAHSQDAASADGDRPGYFFQAAEESVTGQQIQEFIKTSLKEEKLDDTVLDFGEWLNQAEKAGMNAGLVFYLRQASQSQLLLPELVLQ